MKSGSALAVSQWCIQLLLAPIDATTRRGWLFPNGDGPATDKKQINKTTVIRRSTESK